MTLLLQLRVAVLQLLLDVACRLVGAVSWILGYNILNTDLPESNAASYKGTRPSPPKAIALVWAEEAVQDSAVKQLADILRWCQHDSFETAYIYDASGELKDRSEQLRDAISHRTCNIQVGWRDEPIGSCLRCEACCQAATPAADPSRTHSPAQVPSPRGRPAAAPASAAADGCERGSALGAAAAAASSLQATGQAGSGSAGAVAAAAAATMRGSGAAACNGCYRVSGDGAGGAAGAGQAAKRCGACGRQPGWAGRPAADGQAQAQGPAGPSCAASGTPPEQPGALQAAAGRGGAAAEGAKGTAREGMAGAYGTHTCSCRTDPAAQHGTAGGSADAGSCLPGGQHNDNAITASPAGCNGHSAAAAPSPHGSALAPAARPLPASASPSCLAHVLDSDLSPAAQGAGLSASAGEPRPVGRVRAAAESAVPPLQVHVLSAEDGYEPVLRVAASGGRCAGCGAVLPLKGGPYREELARLRAQMEQLAGPAVLGQPELVLVVGPVLSLAGYPPFQVAASEVLPLGPAAGLGRRQVDAALARYARTQQRFGT